jgi:AraC-like DNA-binding protein
MEYFQAIQPSPSLSPYVKQYWFLTSGCTGHVQGIIPTGYISLFFHRANPLFSIEKNETCSQAYICGQSTSYSNLLLTGTTDMVAIDFLPYGAKQFFDIPIHKLNGETVALDLLGEPEWVELGKRLSEMTDNNHCVGLIENFMIKRLSYTKEYNLRRMIAAVNAINRGETEISRLSEISCLSYKQFSRVFSEYVGANPKDFLRIIRFQKALFTLQTSPKINLTQLAYDCDFYDQSHLIREFRSFSGYTPGEYIAACEPYSDYFT